MKWMLPGDPRPPRRETDVQTTLPIDFRRLGLTKPQPIKDHEEKKR